MGSNALHRLRHHSRRLAAAAVAVFALNWVGLALMPCAMAYALPASPPEAAAGAVHSQAPDAMPAGCPGHAGIAAPSDDTPAAAPSGEPCPWCLEAGTTGGDHDTGCGAVPKPALDSRDAKNPVTPLLVALSAAVLGVVPFATSSPSFAPPDDVLPPAAPAVDRYCRRLE
jgi:hypothetical protein